MPPRRSAQATRDASGEMATAWKVRTAYIASRNASSSDGFCAKSAEQTKSRRNEKRRMAGKDSEFPLSKRRLCRRAPKAHERLDLVRRHGRAEEIALHEIAGMQPEERVLLVRLHAFGHDG